ncbi:breast cancer type 2 susceptibility protein homolog isoform X3 [Dermacentor albipictus]|uniref:breast cancer type 2 susceptibility protein homolog isoform X3 n=1 Tax=Dermacentor albipictus TaxID=60249 RepID=UPI0038FC71BC
MSHDGVLNQPRFHMYDDDDDHQSLFEAFVSHTAKDLGPIDEDWFSNERASQFSECSEFRSSGSSTPVASPCLARDKAETPGSPANTPVSSCRRNASFLEWTPLSPSPVVSNVFKTPKVPKSLPQSLAVNKTTPSPLWSPSLETPPHGTARSKKDTKAFAPRNLFHLSTKSQQSPSSGSEDDFKDVLSDKEENFDSVPGGPKKEVPVHKSETHNDSHFNSEGMHKKQVESSCDALLLGSQNYSTCTDHNLVKVAPIRYPSYRASRSLCVDAKIGENGDCVIPNVDIDCQAHHLTVTRTCHSHVPGMTVVTPPVPFPCHPKECLKLVLKQENTTTAPFVFLPSAATSPNATSETHSSSHGEFFSSTSKEFSFSEDKSDGVFGRTDLSLTQMFEVAESTIACIEAADIGFTQCTTSGSEALSDNGPGSTTNEVESKRYKGKVKKTPGTQLLPLHSGITHGSRPALSTKNVEIFDHLDVDGKPLATVGDSTVSTSFKTGSGKPVVVLESSLSSAKGMLSVTDEAVNNNRESLQAPADLGQTRATTAQFYCEARSKAPSTESLNKPVSTLLASGHGKAVKDLDHLLAKPKSQPGLLTSGFVTAGGKPVYVQEEALSRAHQFLSDVPCTLVQAAMQSNNAPTFITTGTGKAVTVTVDALTTKEQHSLLRSGFMTAGGKAVYVQEDGVNRARQIFSQSICNVPAEELVRNSMSTQPNGRDKMAVKHMDNPLGSPKAQPGTVISGFVNAGGKPVYVQEEVLSHAHQLISQSPADSPKREHQNDTMPTFFTTGMGKAVTVSVDSLTNSKEQHGSFKSSFTTAGGKAVYIQEEGLSYARQLLSENSCKAPGEESQQNSLSTLLHGGDEKVAKEWPNSTTKPEAQPGKLTSGFVTAGGKPVYVQEEALSHAHQFLSEGSTVSSRAFLQDSTVPTFFTTCTGKALTVSADSLAKSEKQHSSLTLGFTTAGGQPVLVKEEALNHACQLLSEVSAIIPEESFQQNTVPTFFTTSSGNKVQVSAESLKTAEMLLNEKRDPLQTVPTEKNCKEYNLLTRPANMENSSHVLTGFKTGSEKAVSVSKKSLLNVRSILSIDDTGTSSGSLRGPDRSADQAVSNENESIQRLPQSNNMVSDDAKKGQRALESKQDVLNQEAKNSTPTDKGTSSANVRACRSLSEKRTPASGLTRLGHVGTPMFSSKMKSASKTSFITPFKAVVMGKAQTPVAATRAVSGPRTLFQDKAIRPGKLWILRRVMKSARLFLRDALQGQHPKFYSLDQLKSYGVLESTTAVNAQNAADFVFYISSSDSLLILGDGATMRLESTDMHLGKDEFSRAFFSMPGVDADLVAPGWLENHYRWIVWKLASMELHCPQVFGARSLTPDQVMLQLKYRYDIEIDNSCRSALRKIYERDDVPSKALVLCVSALECKEDGAVQLELTDGWYSIRAELDEPLSRLASTGHLFVGLKLLTSGAELVGSAEACAPLEAPKDTALKMSYNSTRRARWDVRLGYFAAPRPFRVSLSSLHPKGGLVGRVDCLVIRAYPVMYLEMLPNGMGVMRHEKEELMVAAKHDKVRAAFIEKLTAEVLSQVEKSDTEELQLSGIRMSYSVKQIQGLNSGRDIWKAMRNSSDPSEIERLLNEEQLRLLRSFQEEQLCHRQTTIQQKLESALQTATDENKCPKERVVIPVLKVLLGGIHEADLRKNICCLMCVWRPTEDTQELLKQGKALSIYNVNVTCSRKVLPDIQNSAVELTTTKMTQFEPVECPDHVRIYYMRQAAEESVEKGEFLSATDVTLRMGNADRIATVETTEFSVLTSSPTSNTLQRALSALKSSIEDPSNFATTALARLQAPLRNSSPSIAQRPQYAPQQTTKLASPATPNTAPVRVPGAISRTPTEQRPSDGTGTDGLLLPKRKIEVEPGSPAEALSKHVRSKIALLERYTALAPISLLVTPPSAKARVHFRSVRGSPKNDPQQESPPMDFD